MAVDRLPEKELEYYTSAQEVVQEEDRVEIDIHIHGWSKKMRIRALSFEQMEVINRRSTVQVTDQEKGLIAGTLDHAEWVYNTIKEGVVIPRFTYTSAKALADNNGEFVRELADEIWQLGRISKKMWDTFIKEQTLLNKVESSESLTEDEQHDVRTT